MRLLNSTECNSVSDHEKHAQACYKFVIYSESVGFSLLPFVRRWFATTGPKRAETKLNKMPNPYTIRSAREEDQPAIKALIREGGINPLGIHWPRFLVAEDGVENLIGCGQVKAHGDGSRELASLAVTRSWRGQGVAGQLIQTLQEEHGPPLWLTCMDHLVPFYDQFNFRSIKTADEMPAYFSRAARFFNLYLALTRRKGRLAVMVWEAGYRQQ
jgi:N-acetylglutamate synthase-like GNAT family acetyltransferase